MPFTMGFSARVIVGPRSVGVAGVGTGSAGADFSAVWDASCLSCNSSPGIDILKGIRVGTDERRLVGTDGPLEAGTLSDAGPPVPFGEISRETLVGIVGLFSAPTLTNPLPAVS